MTYQKHIDGGLFPLVLKVVDVRSTGQSTTKS